MQNYIFKRYSLKLGWGFASVISFQSWNLIISAHNVFAMYSRCKSPTIQSNNILVWTIVTSKIDVLLNFMAGSSLSKWANYLTVACRMCHRSWKIANQTLHFKDQIHLCLRVSFNEVSHLCTCTQIGACACENAHVCLHACTYMTCYVYFSCMYRCRIDQTIKKSLSISTTC